MKLKIVSYEAWKFAYTADTTSRSVVAEPRAKRALLDYFKTHSLMGKMEPNLQVRLYGKLQQKEVWQLFPKNVA